MSVCVYVYMQGWMDKVRCSRMDRIECSRMESDRVLVIEMSESQHATLFVYGVHCTRGSALLVITFSSKNCSLAASSLQS